MAHIGEWGLWPRNNRKNNFSKDSISLRFPGWFAVLDIIVGQAQLFMAVGIHEVDLPISVAVALEGQP